MQNEGLRRRSWRQRPAWRRRWPGGPGGVQPGRGGMEGQVAAPHPKGLEAANLEGLETAEVLEATAGLDVEANLEVLESVGLEAVVETNLEGLEAVVETNLEGLEAVVGTNLEVPAVASTWWRSAWRARRRSAWRARRRSAWRARRRSAWRARRRRRSAWRARRRRRSAWRARRRRRPGGPGGGGSSSKEMRRRCGGPGGWPGGGPGGDGPGGGGRLGDPAVEVRRWLVIRPTCSSSMEGLKESLGMKITAQGLTTPPPHSSFRRSVLMVQAVKPPPL
ncbi:uncharacterized protein LOC132460160 isoform X2 [Gadus macrocephalus]|uniref:uncharacterized protein LOC132460160 isoform X2 n=1 Tax=Gadus macrocephalus TaxID=80720 RepID=UPI0028CB674A|nr:uncharacterized protein LOC132460160 isoform X2 [Gadus macrocephalus]